MQMFTLSANDLMECWFESEAMRQVYAVHCVSSNFSSLDAPGSAFPFFINVLGEFEGKRGRWGLAKGTPDYNGVARRVMRPDIYLEAMKELGVKVAVQEEKTVTLFDSTMDIKDPEKYAQSFPVNSIAG